MIRRSLKGRVTLAVGLFLGLVGVIALTGRAEAGCYVCGNSGPPFYMASCVYAGPRPQPGAYLSCVVSNGTCILSGDCGFTLRDEVDIDGRIAATSEMIAESWLQATVAPSGAHSLSELIQDLYTTKTCRGLVLLSAGDALADDSL